MLRDAGRPFLFTAIIAVSLSCTLCCSPAATNPSTRGARDDRAPPIKTRAAVLGYSTPWGDAYYPPSAYDYAVYTHLLRSFLEPHADGSVTAPDAFFNPELERQAKRHGVRLLASVGGGSRDASQWLSMARNERATARLFDELEHLITTHGYDGVDIDWEPSAHDAADERTFTAFMQALRARFPKWIITTALGTGEWNAQYVDWPKIAETVDYINLMTYVYTGEWSGHSGHNAALYRSSAYSDADALDVNMNVRAVVGKYGVPPSKLALGLAFFGLQFSTDKLGDKLGPNAEYHGQEINYSDVALLEQSGEYAKRWDDAAHAPYLERKLGAHTVSFDDSRSIADKCAYAREQGLGGLMVWYLGADVTGGRPVLEQAVARSVGVEPAEPPIAFRQQYYRARRAQIRELGDRLERAKSELSALDPKAAATLAKTALPETPEQPSSDASALAADTRAVETGIVQLKAALDAIARRIESVPIDARRGRAVSAQGRTHSLGTFDSVLGSPLGGTWQSEFDHNGLGTTLSPFPLTIAKEGSESALHMSGHFGKSQAPWPYASLLATFPKADLNAFAAIRFRARGDGKKYSVVLIRDAVRDHATHRAQFVAGREWVRVELPFSAFQQPDWGKRVTPGWYDVTGIAFTPNAEFNDEDFNLWVDDVELVAK